MQIESPSEREFQPGTDEVPTAIYRAALSLDSFLLNGILYGILTPFGPEFLDARAASLRCDLTTLETQVPASAARTLRALRATSERLVSNVTDLTTFRTQPLDQVLATVARIVALCSESVARIEELEAHFGISATFYASRPADSTASVNAFFDDLDTIFTQAWTTSQLAPHTAEGHP